MEALHDQHPSLRHPLPLRDDSPPDVPESSTSSYTRQPLHTPSSLTGQLGIHLPTPPFKEWRESEKTNTTDSDPSLPSSSHSSEEEDTFYSTSCGTAFSLKKHKKDN